jgi:hypothetical protein
MLVLRDQNTKKKVWNSQVIRDQKSLVAVEMKGTLCHVCRLEMMLFKLEIMDHKARERAGLIIPTFSAPIPVILKLDSAMEVNILIFTCWTPVLSKSLFIWSSKGLIMINSEIYLCIQIFMFRARHKWCSR